MAKFDSVFNSYSHPISLNRRGFLRSCCLASLAFWASVSCANRQPDASDVSEASVGNQAKLRVGHLPAGCVSHLLLANKRGLFKDAGLNVELTQFNGPGENLQALVAGAQDVIHNPWTNTVAAFANGTDQLRIVGGSGKGGIELVAREGSVTSLEELAAAAGQGLRIGTLQLDTLELVVFGHLQSLGVSYEDYEMTFFPSMVGMGEALIQGTADVCSLAQPYAQSVVAESGGTYLGDSNGAWGPEAADCVITSTTSLIDKESNMLADYLAVLRQSAEMMEADYESAIADLVPLYGADPEILATALKRQVPQPVLDGAGVQSLKNGVGLLADLGYLKPEQENLINVVFDETAQEKSLKVS